MSSKYIPLSDVGKEEANHPVETKEASQDETDIILKFANHLMTAFGKIPNLREALTVRHIKANKKNREKITLEVPCYKRNLAIYAVNKYLEKHCDIKEIVDFCNEGREYYPPKYQNIETKRGIKETLFTEGEYFLYYKKVPIVVMMNFNCREPEAVFTFNKKHRKLVSGLVESIDDFMKHNNFLKNEKLKLMSGLYFSFLEYPTMNWDDIIINDNLKEDLMINLVFPLKNKKLCKKFGLAWRRGLLLGGEPGTGKTKLAKILCNLIDDCTVIWVTAESIDESSDVKRLFEAARELAPTLIIMEDIDFFGKDREIVHSPVLGELLNQLDGNAPNEGIFVIASSNRPGLLDKALVNRPGRFDVKLEFKLPDVQCRTRMLTLFSKDKKFSTDINFNEVVQSTHNFTGAQIQELLVYATLECLHKKNTVITQANLNSAAKKVRDNYKIDSKMVV